MYIYIYLVFIPKFKRGQKMLKDNTQCPHHHFKISKTYTSFVRNTHVKSVDI